MVMLSAFRRYGRMLAILTDHHGIAASSELAQVYIRYHWSSQDQMGPIRELGRRCYLTTGQMILPWHAISFYHVVTLV